MLTHFTTQDPRERPNMTNVLDTLLKIRKDVVERQKEEALANGGWGWVLPWFT